MIIREQTKRGAYVLRLEYTEPEGLTCVIVEDWSADGEPVIYNNVLSTEHARALWQVFEHFGFMHVLFP